MITKDNEKPLRYRVLFESVFEYIKNRSIDIFKKDMVFPPQIQPVWIVHIYLDLCSSGSAIDSAKRWLRCYFDPTYTISKLFIKYDQINKDIEFKLSNKDLSNEVD